MSGRGRGRGRGRGGGTSGLPLARDDDGTVLAANAVIAPSSFPDLKVRHAPRKKDRKLNAEIGKLRSQLRIFMAEFPAYKDSKAIKTGGDWDGVESYTQSQKRLTKGSAADKASLNQLLTLETSYFPAMLTGKQARETSRRASATVAAFADAALARFEAIEEQEDVKRRPDDENEGDAPKGEGGEEEEEADMEPEEDELEDDDDYAQGEDYQDDEEYDYNDDGGDDGPFF